MKFFIDTAKVEDIKAANDMGVICGVTTNPSLIAGMWPYGHGTKPPKTNPELTVHTPQWRNSRQRNSFCFLQIFLL